LLGTLGVELGAVDKSEIRPAGQGFDRDADQRFDQRASLSDQPAEPMTGEQVLPGLVVLLLADAQHRPRRQGARRLSAVLHAGDGGTFIHLKNSAGIFAPSGCGPNALKSSTFALLSGVTPSLSFLLRAVS